MGKEYFLRFISMFTTERRICCKSYIVIFIGLEEANSKKFYGFLTLKCIKAMKLAAKYNLLYFYLNLLKQGEH